MLSAAGGPVLCYPLNADFIAVIFGGLVTAVVMSVLILLGKRIKPSKHTFERHYLAAGALIFFVAFIFFLAWLNPDSACRVDDSYCN